jgi:hypothetical protein
MNVIARTRGALSLFLVLVLAGVSTAQQELYVLGRFNKIWRVDNYTTATPTRTEIVTWGTDGQISAPVGLETDPSTGDFLVLMSDWGGYFATSELVRVDPTSGIGTVVMSLPATMMRGLDRRWDGKLYSINNGEELWLIDLVAGTWIVEPLSATVGSFWSPVAVDARGGLVSETPNLVSIDPFSGDVSPLPVALPNTSQLGLEIDAGGITYSVGVSADLHRFDPAVGVWVQLFPSWNEMSNGYDLAFTEPVDGAGFAQICDGLPNSTGLGSTLELLGGNLASAGDLELVGRQLPANQFGYYVMSDTAGSFPVGQGVLCMGFPVYRFSSNVLNTGAAGEVRFPLNLNQLANGLAAMAGDTYFFQYWHRDFAQGVATSNLSAAVSVTFQ